METKTTLTGLDTLRWLHAAGAKFCKVAAWNETGEWCTDPGKQAFPKGWQDNPLTTEAAVKHLKAGGNIGLLAGDLSEDKQGGHLCILDADENYSQFVDMFPWAKDAPTIIRDGADKGKIIILVTGELPKIKRFKHNPGDKHPFFEYLATGSQGVIAGRHPAAGADYTLINTEKGIPSFTPAKLNAICEIWTGQSLAEFETHQVQERKTQSAATQRSGGDGLLENVLGYWTSLKVFEHFNRAGEVRRKGGELKLGGNGGLYVDPDGNRWFCFSADLGGGPFQAWQYCKNGNTDTPTGRGFYELLCEMATAANIPIPQPTRPEMPPEPEMPPLEGTLPNLPPVQKRQTRWTAQELAAAHFEDPKWAVKGLIPVGLTFLAGRPKVGKSWLALQIAQAVGSGGRVFDMTVEKGKVFYLALEDNGRRLQERSNKQRADLLHAEITFETSFKALGEGGLNDLYAELLVNDYRLVIIDTLSRALGGADQMDPAEMTMILGKLQQIALQREIAILLVDHHRKSNGFESDPIDDIANSTAKAAVADGAIGLYRERGKRGEGLLRVRGRDMEDQELALKWDPELCCWQCLGDADQVREDTNLGKVYQALIDLAKDGQLPTTDRTADYLELKKPNVSALLNELVNRGQAIRGERAGREVPYYALINGLPVKGQAI